jgi:RecA-family ATPase
MSANGRLTDEQRAEVANRLADWDVVAHGPAPRLRDAEAELRVPSNGGPQLLAEPLTRDDLQATRWAWEDRIPLGAVTLLAGIEGRGKSTLATELAARLSRGELDGDLRGEPASTLLVSYEDTRSTLTGRAVAADGALDMIATLRLVGEDGRDDLISLPGHLDLLAEEAQRYKARLLVLDPLVSALTGGIDSHRDADVRRVLAPLAQLAEEREMAVLALIHLRKSSATEGLHRVSGSIAFTAAARSVLAFGRPEGGEEDNGDGLDRVLAHAKSNLGPLAPSLAYRVEQAHLDHEGERIRTSRMVYDCESDTRAGELLSPPPAEDRSEVDVATDWLADRLGDGDWHATADVREAAKRDDIAARTLQRAAQRIGVESERQGFPSRGHWRLADSRANRSGATGDGASGNPLCDAESEGSAPQPRQNAHYGATEATEAEEAEAARLAARFGGEA